METQVGMYLPVTGNQISKLKQKVLKQAYDQQTHQVKPESSTTNPETKSNYQQSSIRSSRSVQVLPSYPANDRKQEIRQMLKESYNDDIARKESKRQQEKKKIRQEQDSLTLLNSINTSPLKDKKKVQQEYAQFLQSQIQRKKSENVRLKREDSLLEQQRHNKSHKLINKQHSFKQYYKNYEQFRDNINSDYLNYVSQKKRKEEEKHKNELNLLQRQKQIADTKAQQEKNKSLQRKNELRQVLEKQIMQNRSFKAAQSREYRNRGYIKSEMNLYNPISNPIDYKVDINNRYLLQEIIRRQSQPSSI